MTATQHTIPRRLGPHQTNKDSYGDHRLHLIFFSLACACTSFNVTLFPRPPRIAFALIVIDEISARPMSRAWARITVIDDAFTADHSNPSVIAATHERSIRVGAISMDAGVKHYALVDILITNATRPSIIAVAHVRSIRVGAVPVDTGVKHVALVDILIAVATRPPIMAVAHVRSVGVVAFPVVAGPSYALVHILITVATSPPVIAATHVRSIRICTISMDARIEHFALVDVLIAFNSRPPRVAGTRICIISYLASSV